MFSAQRQRDGDVQSHGDVQRDAVFKGVWCSVRCVQRGEVFRGV